MLTPNNALKRIVLLVNEPALIDFFYDRFYKICSVLARYLVVLIEVLVAVVVVQAVPKLTFFLRYIWIVGKMLGLWFFVLFVTISSQLCTSVQANPDAIQQGMYGVEKMFFKIVLWYIISQLLFYRFCISYLFIYFYYMIMIDI